jgi:protein-S-isoprenylcysteine O-methyltransferase Ste14
MESPGSRYHSQVVRFLTLAYGGAAYLGFLGIFAYFVGFLTNGVVPRTVDDAVFANSRAIAIAIDVALVSVFALQHTIMARPAFKERWTRLVPQAIERSTFVWAANLSLALLFWQWRSLPEVMWHVDIEALRAAMWGLFGVGIGIILISSFLIDHFELFGLRQVFEHWRGERGTSAGFRTPLLYRFVRHPMMVGVAIFLWATPTMTLGHLVFAASMTTYLILGVQIEERDLVRLLGDDYVAYQDKVPQLVPRITPGVD